MTKPNLTVAIIRKKDGERIRKEGNWNILKVNIEVLKFAIEKNIQRREAIYGPGMPKLR